MKPSHIRVSVAVRSQLGEFGKFLGSGLESGFWDFPLLKLQAHWEVLW